MEQRLIAFWKNDRFPYLLSGEVEKFNEYGSVYIPSYDRWFQPLFVLPYKDGVHLKNELSILEQQRKNELDKLSREFDAQLMKIGVEGLLPEGVKLHG